MEPTPAEKSNHPSSGPNERPVVEVPAKELTEVLEAVPAEQRRKLELILLQQSVMAKSHRGPLPPPEDFEKYCVLIPNGGDRIMAQYEKQSDHRIDLEKNALTSQMAQSRTGQWMGFLLGLVGLGTSGVCICTGHDAAGAALGGTTLVGLVSVFVAGKTEIFKSLLRKRPDRLVDNEAKSLQAEESIEVQKEVGSAPESGD